MKIYSSRADDIRRQKAEYDEKLQNYKEKDQQAYESFHRAERSVTEPIETYVKNELSSFNLLDFDVWATGSRYGSQGVEVNVRCNDSRVHDNTSALSWNWRIWVTRDGELKKESGSWSGLQACTREQLDSLHQTVQALDVLNAIDWERVLKEARMPEYSDFYTELPEKPAYRDFDKELADAELADLAGTDTFVHVTRIVDGNERTGWFKINRETPSSFYGLWVPEYYADQLAEFAETHGKYEDKILKKNIQVKLPLQTKSL